MTFINRPAAVITILKTIRSGPDTQIGDQLEAYIADLEAKQPVRPHEITEILSVIGSRYTVTLQNLLENYLEALEVKQQPVTQVKNHSAFANNVLPVWSHQRVVERERRHKEHALVKQMLIDGEKSAYQQS